MAGCGQFTTTKGIQQGQPLVRIWKLGFGADDRAPQIGDPMSNLLGAIQKNRESLLQDWLKRLKAAVQRRDLISDRELETQAAEILSTLAEVPQGTTLEDFNAPGWQPL